MKIEKFLNTVELVSFDMFDTLIYRVNPKTGAVLTDPDDVFRLMEIQYDAPGFADARISTESVVWKTPTPEITFENIYKLMPKQFHRMKHLELIWEIENCVPNMAVKQVYDQITIPKIITSDMYLGADILSAMLETCGINDYTKLYVSSDVGTTKVCGGMYSHISIDMDVAPNKILHIGDNRKSDFEMAEKMGLRACWYNTR